MTEKVADRRHPPGPDYIVNADWDDGWFDAMGNSVSQDALDMPIPVPEALLA